MLYDVSFTTQKLVKHLDARGKIVSEERFDRPITLTALPHAAAMSYSGCDNFVIITHVEEPDRRSTPRPKGVDWGAAATKKVEHRASPGKKAKPPIAGTRKLSSAETGDLAAAVSS